jgi:SAM-dependent methyltransferase
MKPTVTRFTNTVSEFARFRPTYPSQIVLILEKEIGLDSNHIVADIGCGTGHSSAIFIKNKNRVYGVEPNVEMRKAADQRFKNEYLFTSINGLAESTKLPNKTIDLIFCGQAFHWFDVPRTKAEFERILKSGGHIVLAWNQRDHSSRFQQAYDQMLRRNIDEYNMKGVVNIDEDKIKAFFSPKKYFQVTLPNFQLFDLASLKGRVSSSSYCPEKTTISYANLMIKTENLFHAFEENGFVLFEYQTKLYWY